MKEDLRFCWKGIYRFFKKKKKKKKKKTGVVGPVVQQIKFGMAQAIQNKNTVLLADQRKR